MKICKIHIRGFQQFEDTILDFTHPETGEPLDKICFIGRNGTGKSTLLKVIQQLILEPSSNFGNGLILIELKHTDQQLSILQTPKGLFVFNLSDSIILNQLIQVLDMPKQDQLYQQLTELDNLLNKPWGGAFWTDLLLKDNTSDLLIYSPTEASISNTTITANKIIQRSVDIIDIPKTNLNDALKLFSHFPFYHVVSEQNIREFWQILIFLIKKRENEREDFENLPENLNKTKKQLIDEFESQNPKIENKLAELWNKILDKAGLELDLENLKKPVQLTDNLQAYIRLKSTKERINYNQLSTGIRNFIFRIGHIYSLYFNREIKRGFLLVDEPENSLFPDFLFNLMELYNEIVIDKNGENNTQFFVATHSPIVAAQFQPYERIILEWDDHGHVTAHKGYAPIGDDPNDVLEQDFGLENLMGKEGQKMWKKYLELRKKLRRTTDEEEKDTLIREINKIGEQYNFEE